MNVQPGAALGPYEIVAPLGSGGMGEVFEAYDVRLERRVALKVLRADVAADADRLARFTREAKAVAALNHPNILTIHDVGVEDGAPYVVTELLEGEDLREALARRSPSHFQVVGWAIQIAQGLAAAHQKGIVHRDLKPENLFLTVDGRIKILDFGLAKQTAPTAFATSAATATEHGPATASGLVLGTIAYLSPEQAQGFFVDARSDIFSFGIVLWELLARRHPFWRESGGAMLAAILRDTAPPLSIVDPSIPRALDGIVARCLAKEREDRFQGAHDLRLALESVLAAPAGAAALQEVEERSPYPGIASFTEKDAAVFFGREAEVAALWERIRARPILAVIGASGAGKTSFLRAGVLPARPSGWAVTYATPGANPTLGLARALTPEFTGDSAAISELLEGVAELSGGGDSGTMLSAVKRWRHRHAGAVLVVDQFEELFTLNPPETQARFAAALARVASESGTHVVLSLRDDFLMRCHEHPALAPVFDAIVPLGSLKPEGLRRALVEPAKKRGYTFEDEESLVAEMVAAVEGERGALPLLAFAVARLWEKRDRERKLLTRASYEEIGGVAGALAQHAESTLGRIGAEHEAGVREIFRNLVTSQGTRAVMDSRELLSAFPDRCAAGEVLRRLVDAHLLTSYALEAAPSERQAVEIVHESLLSAWPRLVRWRAQDEEGAVLRDQLRQAARLWEEKKRADDLLWSGTAFREFELWRERYRGALTALEEEFGRAMRARAQRRRRAQRLAVGAVIASLALGALAVWVSRQNAMTAARRAEAAKLLAIGQERLDEDPTEALAFTTASLELDDTWAARLHALRTLWEAPPAFELHERDRGAAFHLSFSPDGRFLADGGYAGDNARVLPDDGGPRRELPGHAGIPHWFDGRLLLDEDARMTLWSLPDLRLEKTVELGSLSAVVPIGSRVFLRSDSGGTRQYKPDEFRLRSWAPGEQALTDLGRVPFDLTQLFALGGRYSLTIRGAAVIGRALPVRPGDPGATLVEHPPAIVTCSSSGDKVVTVNAAAERKVWTFEPGKPPRGEDVPIPQTANGGTRLSDEWMFAMANQAAHLWPRNSWSAARPLALRRSASWWYARLALSPGGGWLAASTERSDGRITFWPLAKRYPFVVEGLQTQNKHVAFSPDGRWLASSWPGGFRLWPMGGYAPRRITEPLQDGLGVEAHRIAFDPRGRFLLCIGLTPWLVPLDGGPLRPLQKGFRTVPWIWAGAFSPSGRFVAAGRATGNGDHVLVVWDLERGTSRSYPLPRADGPSPFTEGIVSAAFADDATLYTAGAGGIRRWDLARGGEELVIGKDAEAWAEIRPDKGFAVTLRDGVLSIHDLARRTSREIPRFGSRNTSFALDPSGTVLAAADADAIRVGRLSGGEPHLLVGHKGGVGGKSASATGGLAISPDLKWLASAGADATLRLWPMPDLDAPPLHALSHAELIAMLKSLTNLRAVRDAKAANGWTIDLAPFPGWRTAPTWEP